MRRMELWATLPNTVFLSSLNKAAQARDPPSAMNRGDEDLNSCCERQDGSGEEAPQQRGGGGGTYCNLTPNRSKPEKHREASQDLCGLVIRNAALTILWTVPDEGRNMSGQRSPHQRWATGSDATQLEADSRYSGRPARRRRSTGRLCEGTPVSRTPGGRGGIHGGYMVEEGDRGAIREISSFSCFLSGDEHKHVCSSSQLNKSFGGF